MQSFVAPQSAVTTLVSDRCLLCDSSGGIVPLALRQPLSQATHLLNALSRRVAPGKILDIGCNFGVFLRLAQQRGWEACGYEPNGEASESCVEAGFDVRSGWELVECGFAADEFSAVSVVDAFCFSLHPFADLTTYYRLLRPGGVLAMRLTNKHTLIKLAYRFLSPSRREAAISRLLLGQFHSASLNTVRCWLTKVGFREISIESRAMSVPWREARWRARLGYAAADLLRLGTLGTLNISPGILVYARKPA
jgi:SAM-dependent methyltransferase